MSSLTIARHSEVKRLFSLELPCLKSILHIDVYAADAGAEGFQHPRFRAGRSIVMHVDRDGFVGIGFADLEAGDVLGLDVEGNRAAEGVARAVLLYVAGDGGAALAGDEDLGSAFVAGPTMRARAGGEKKDQETQCEMLHVISCVIQVDATIGSK